MAATPDVSVLIRVRNEVAQLEHLLRTLAAQETPLSVEIVVVDNASTDGSAEVASGHQAEIVSISQEDFTYGRALNLGMSRCSAPLVLIISAHCVPLGRGFLTKVVEPFSDPRMVGVRCVRADSSDALKWLNPVDIGFSSQEEQNVWEATESWTATYPAAGCCMIRREAWLEEPFDETLESNEDKIWFSAALGRGWKVRAFVEAFYVYTRKRLPHESFRRWDLDHLALYRHTHRAPLSWSVFARNVVRTIVGTPLAAWRHLVNGLHWNLLQVTVPIRARRRRKSGSLQEFRHKG